MIKLDIRYTITKVEPGESIAQNSEQRKENLEKIEKLKADDPTFKQFIDEFGLELD